MREDRILNMLKEVVEDKRTGHRYWFDIEAYKDARDFPTPLSTRDICTKLKLNTEIEVVSDEAFMKQVRRFNNYVDDCKNGVFGDVDFIKNLGLALTGNEMEFLIPITVDSFSQIANRIRNQTNIEGANAIYKKLNQVLYLLELSCYFYYIPNSKEDGEEYFSKMMLNIRKDVDEVFGDMPQARRTMYELIDEVDYILNTCEVPGVVDKWLEINPRLNYFDCVYEVITEEPLMYERIKYGDLKDIKRRFKFFPSITEVLERDKYFEEKHRMFPTRSNDRLYQDELVETLNMRFNECMGVIKNNLEE